MRKVSLLFVVLAACELQPAPPPQAAPSTPAAPAPAPTPPAPPPADAGPGGDAGAWREGCSDAGIHIAAVIIDTTPDPGQRSIYEQDREKMVRAMADACTAQGWSADALKCYSAATTQADLKACEKKYTPVPTPPPAPKVDENAAPLPPGRVPGTPPAAGSGATAPTAPTAPKATTPKAPKAATPAPKPPAPKPPAPAAKGTGSGSAAKTR